MRRPIQKKPERTSKKKKSCQFHGHTTRKNPQSQVSEYFSKLTTRGNIAADLKYHKWGVHEQNKHIINQRRPSGMNAEIPTIKTHLLTTKRTPRSTLQSWRNVTTSPKKPVNPDSVPHSHFASDISEFFRKHPSAKHTSVDKVLGLKVCSSSVIGQFKPIGSSSNGPCATGGK